MAKVNTEALSHPSPDDWRTREDVSDLMRPHALRQDKARHCRALDMMRGTLEHEEAEYENERPKAKRVSRRTTTRSAKR
jgi:hypothetical protein